MKSQASHEQSQGFPSSRILVDIRGMKTRVETRVILFSDKSKSDKFVWSPKLFGWMVVILFLLRLSVERLVSPFSMDSFTTSIRFPLRLSSLRMEGRLNQAGFISVRRFCSKLRLRRLRKEPKASSEIPVTPAFSIHNLVTEVRLSLRNTVELIPPTSFRPRNRDV